jgi:hypothetical protein
MMKLIKRIAIAVGILGFIAVVWANRSGKFISKPFNYGGQLIPVSESTQWKPGLIPVRLGIFADNMYAFDVATQSVAVEGAVWITWPEAFQQVLDSEGLTVDQVVNPVNRVNSWDYIMRPLYAKPIRTPSGEFHQVLRFASRFYVDDLDLHRYPFERIDFPIVFGLSTLSDAFGVDKVRLIADVPQSGVGPYVDILGYVTDTFQVREYIQHYATGFGYSRDGQKTSSAFGQVRLEIGYKKSAFAAIQQLILPLLVVMLMVLVSPNLGASLWDVRIAIPSTALLTLVFLQQGYRQSLPLLPYLTFLDQIYAECYIVTFALFLLFVWASNKLNDAPESEKEAVSAYLNRVDSRYQWLLVAFLLTTTTLNYLFPLGRLIP